MAFEISDSFSESIFSGQQTQDQGPSGGGDIYGLPPRTEGKPFEQGGGMGFGDTGPSPYAASDPWASTDIGQSFYPTRPQALPSMVQGADQPESDWGSVLGAVFTQFPSIMKKELGALIEAPARTIGLDSLAEMGRGWSHEADNELQRTTPNMGDGTMKSWVYQAGTSTLQSLAAGAASVAFMGPAGVTAAFARGIGGKLLTMAPFMTMSAAGKYADMRESGFSNAASLAAATPYGLIDGATELIGFAGALKPGIGIAKRMALTLGGELVGEEIATPSQMLIDKMTTNPELTWDDLWRQMRDTAATVPLQAGVMGAGGHVLDRYRPKQKTQISDEDRASLGNAIRISMGPVMENYRNIEATEGTERARQYIQLAFNGVDPADIAEPLTRRQIEENTAMAMERNMAGELADQDMPQAQAEPGYAPAEVVQPAGTVPQAAVGPGGIPARTPISQTPPDLAPGQRAERAYGRDGLPIGWRVVNDPGAPLNPPPAPVGGMTLLPNNVGVDAGAAGVEPGSLVNEAARMSMLPAAPGVPLRGVVPPGVQVPTGQQAMALARVIFPGGPITQDHVDAAVALMQQLGPQELQARLPAPPPDDPVATRYWNEAFGYTTPEGPANIPGFGAPTQLGGTMDVPLEGFGQGQPIPVKPAFTTPPPKPVFGKGPGTQPLPNLPRRGKLELAPAPGEIGVPGTASMAAANAAASASQQQGALSPEGAAPGPNTGTTYTPANQPVQFKYRAVEAGDLITSNNPDMGLSVNPNFPAELQPRNRDRMALKLQVDGLVNKLNPARVAESAEVGNGAPVIGADMIVEVGNGRTVAIKRIYGEKQNSSKAKEYKSWLVGSAEKYGLDPATVNAMKAPVLVRERTSPVTDRVQFVKDANVQTTASMGATETGRADADRMTDSILASFVPGSGLLTLENKDFIRSFMATIPDTERNAIVTADGQTLTPEGVKRIKDALLFKAFGDVQLLNRISEEGDEDTRNLSKAIMESAPVIAKYKAAVAAGTVHNRDISAQIVAAANKLNALKKNGESVYAYVENEALTDDTINNHGKALLVAFDSMKRSKGAIETFFNEYTAAAEALGDPNQQTLLDQSALPTVDDLIQYAYDKATEGKKYGTTIFADKSKEAGLLEEAEGSTPSIAEVIPARPAAPGQGNQPGAVEGSQRPEAAARASEETGQPAPVADEKEVAPKLKTKRLTVAQQKRAMDLIKQDSSLSMKAAAAQVRAEDAKPKAESERDKWNRISQEKMALEDKIRELSDNKIYIWGTRDGSPYYVINGTEVYPDLSDYSQKYSGYPGLWDTILKHADKVKEQDAFSAEIAKPAEAPAASIAEEPIPEAKRTARAQEKAPAARIESPVRIMGEYSVGDHVIYQGKERVVTGEKGNEYILANIDTKEQLLAVEGKDLMPYRAEKTGSLTQTMIPGTTAADTFQLTPSKGEIGTLKPTTPEDQGSLFEAGQREMWNAKAATLPDPAVKAMVENAGLRYDGKANGTHQFTIVSDKADGAHKITWNIGKNQSLNDSMDELNKVWRKDLGRDITLPFVRPSEQEAQATVAERKKTPAEVRDEQLAFGFYEDAVVDMKARAPKAKTLSGLPLKQDVITVGNAFSITADIEKNKATDFRGRKLAGAEDVAVAAGLIRDPRVETVLCLYMKGDTVVGNFAVTSGAATYVNLGLSSELVDQMNNEMAALGADSYYIVHNHPSGHINPSGSQGLGNDWGDIGFTKSCAAAVKGFKAHVIIDHGIYSELTIGKNGMVVTREAIKMDAMMKTPDPLKQGSKPHPVLWQSIGGAGDAALLMKNVGENPSGYITAIYTDAKGFVTGIQHISTHAFVGPLEKVVDLLKRQSFAFGTPGGPILYGEAPFAGGYANNRYSDLIRNGSIVDMVYSGTLTSTSFGPEAYSLRREKGISNVKGMNFNRVTANVGIKEISAHTGVKRDELMKALGDNLLENERITGEVLEGQPFLQESEYSTTLTPAAQRAFPALSNTWIDKAIGTLQSWKDVNKNVRDGDISNFRRTMQQPLMMRDKYPLVGQAQDIELTRQQERSSLQIKLTGDYAKNTIDAPVQNPIMDLSDAEEKIFRKIALESTTGGKDQEGVVFEDAEVQAKARALGADQTQAINIAQTYAAVKVGYDQAMKVRSEHVEKMLYFPYQGEAWVDDLKELAGAKEADMKDVMDRLGIADKYSPKDQERLLRAVATIREPFNLIKQYRKEMGRIKFYVPLEHGRGEFVVRVWDKNEEGEEMALWSYRTETKVQAAAIIDKLKRDPEYMDLRGKRMSVEIEKGTPESLYQRVYDDNLYRFMLIGMERMKAGETYSDDEINGFIKNLSQALSDELKARGFGARMIQRRSPDIKGYELKDQRQAFLDYMSGLAGVVTKQEAAAKYQALLKDVPKNTPNLYDFIAGYSKDMLRNPDRLDRSIDKLKMLATMQYIAGNLRLPLVQITQNFVLSVPEMSRQLKRAGFGTAASLGQAHTRIVGAAWDIARGKLNAQEAHHLALMTNQGVTEAKFLQEIYGRMQNKWAGGFSKMFDYVMYPFMWLERLNRQTAFLAMHRLGVEQAKRQGVEITDEKMQAINQKAIRFVFDTQVLYGKANQPEPMRGAGVSNRLLSLAYTFKQYPHHYLAYVKEAIKEGHGHAIGRMGDDIAKLSMSPALVYQLPKMMLTYMKNALTAPGYDAVMLSMAWMAAFGGVLAWPFIDDILELYERMTGNPVRAKMKRVVHGGVPTMIDMDITNSLKIGAPWTVGTNFGDQLSQSALGVYAGLATNYGKAFSQMWAGNFGRGLEYASPTMIQYPLKAFREYTEGATTGKGKTVFDAEGKPKKLDGWQTFLQAGGIKSAEMSDINRDYRTFSMMTAHYTEERTRIFEETRRALKNQDAAGLEAARAKMEKYNADVAQMGGSIAPINQASLKTALRERPGKRELAFGRLMNTPE